VITPPQCSTSKNSSTTSYPFSWIAYFINNKPITKKLSLIAQSSGSFLIDFDQQQQLLLLLLLCACGQRACVVHHVHGGAMHAHAWIWLVEEAPACSPPSDDG
jgi:hypothetical protein